MTETIFIQVASYRDMELKPTIVDAFAKAKYPENLYFGICWQHDSDENMDEYLTNPKFRIKDVHWKESKGLGWARSEIQKLYQGEKYTLQLDSHHRFVQDWDEMLINMLKDMQADGYSKPIITTYAGVYDPTDPEIFLDSRPFKMVGTNFSSYGTILFYPTPIENWEKINKPIPARFVSGHFFFTLGQHCIEYKYDPEIYFAGDEISLSIRSFTLGYDIFHPHRLVMYHEYTRKGRQKHWDDHTSSIKNTGDIDKVWSERDDLSKKRLRQLLQEEDNGIDLGIYGLGSVRSHHDYELYAGINFKHRQLQEYTTKGNNPPNPVPDNALWYLVKDVTYTVNIRWDKKLFDENIDYQFCLFAAEDKTGGTLARDDVNFDDNKKMFFETCVKKIVFKVKENIVPYKWIMWPYSKTNGWLEKVEHIIKPNEIQSQVL